MNTISTRADLLEPERDLPESMGGPAGMNRGEIADRRAQPLANSAFFEGFARAVAGVLRVIRNLCASAGSRGTGHDGAVEAESSRPEGCSQGEKPASCFIKATAMSSAEQLPESTDDQLDPTSDPAGSSGHFEKKLGARLRSSGIWTLTGRLSSVLLLLLLNVWMTHYMTQTAYGQYALLESVVTIISLVGLGGIPTVGIRYLQKGLVKDDPNYLISVLNACALGFVISASMTLAGTWAFAWATQNHVMPGLLWPYALGAILWGIAFAAVRLISDLLRGFHRYSLSSAIGGQRGGYAANAMLLCLTMAATAFFGMSLFMAVAIQIIVNLIFLGFGIWSLRSVSDWQTASLSDNAHQADFRNTFGEVVSRAWPLLILQLIAFGIPEFDTLLIGSFATPEEAALYRPARLLTMVVSVPLQLVNTTIQPFIAEFEAMRDRRRTTILVRGGAALAAIPSILLLLCFLLFPQTLLSAVFGAKFASAGLALQILSIGFAVFVLTGSCGMVLQMTGHERSAMTSSIACAALYLCTAPWLVSRYGLIGAAVSSASLQVISNIAATLLVYRHERIWTIASLSPAMVIDCCQLAFPRFANKRIAPARDPAANAAANN